MPIENPNFTGTDGAVLATAAVELVLDVESTTTTTAGSRFEC